MAAPSFTLTDLPAEVLQLIAAHVCQHARISHLPLINKHWQDSLAGASTAWDNLDLAFNEGGLNHRHQGAMLRWLYQRASSVTRLTLGDSAEDETGACSALLLVHRTLHCLTIADIRQQATIDHISTCTALRHLNLGVEGDVQLDCLSSLVNLQTLDSPCPAGALHSFLQLTCLTRLSIYNVTDTFVARPEYAHSNLQSIYVDTAGACSMPVALLAGWPCLTELMALSGCSTSPSISFEPAGDPSVTLGTLSMLERVRLEGAHLPAVPACLWKLPRLLHLELFQFGTPPASLDLPDGMSVLTALTELSLCNPLFVGGAVPAMMSAFGLLQSLKLLDVPTLDSTSVFHMLSQLRFLESLTLSECAVPFELRASDIASMLRVRKVEVWSFAKLSIISAGAHSLASHPTLQRISLSGSVIVPNSMEDLLDLAETLAAAGRRKLLTFRW